MKRALVALCMAAATGMAVIAAEAETDAQRAYKEWQAQFLEFFEKA